MMNKTKEWGTLLAAIGMAVAAIVFIVRLKADVENHIKYHPDHKERLAELEAKLAAIEKKIKEPPPPNDEECNSARIVALPTTIGQVPSTTSISWIPAHCKMVVQGYRNERLVNEFQKIPQESGAVTVGQAITRRDGTMNLGMAELKIWVPSSRVPAHQGVYVNVTR